MFKCISCKYYDESVDACNADDKCYLDAYTEGVTVATEVSAKFLMHVCQKYDIAWEEMDSVLKDWMKIQYDTFRGDN